MAETLKPPSAVLPPRADAHGGFAEQRAARERGVMQGTLTAQWREDSLGAMDFVSSAQEGFRETALWAAGRLVDQEGVTGALSKIVGVDLSKPDYNKAEKAPELTAGIPYEFHDEILGNKTYTGALRARARVQEDLARGRRIAGRAGSLAVLAGGLIDADLPLAAFSGGAWQAAKVGRATTRGAKALGLSDRLALRAAGIAEGVNAGAQGGVIVGAVDARSRETTDWTDLANMTLQSMLLGSTTGALAGGDVRASVRATRADFLRRVAEDDPALHRGGVGLAPDPGAALPMPDAFTAPGADISTAGALNLSSPSYQGTVLNDPAGALTGRHGGIIEHADHWRHNSDWLQRKQDAENDLWQKASLGPVGAATVGDFRRLYQSKSAVLNWLAGTVFESASGYGRGEAATSAVLDVMYHRTIIRHVSSNFTPSLLRYAQDTNRTWRNSGFGYSKDAAAEFNRELMLEMNDRRLGRQTSSRHPEVRSMADNIQRSADESLEVARGGPGETPLDGFDPATGVKDRVGYSPMRWSGAAITRLEAAGVVTRKSLVNALEAGYRSTGLFPSAKDARAVARAVLDRAVKKDAEVDMSLWSLLQGDGKAFLQDALENSGLSQQEVDGIMTRLIGGQMDRGKEAFAKSRNDIDMAMPIQTLDGSKLQIVDLLDNDVHLLWQRYARQLSGSAALARVGITNRAMRSEVIAAAQAEQRALGEEPTPAELLEAMLSHFDGGPVNGYAMGQKEPGVHPAAALAKRATNLALLGKLGLSQLAETGGMMAQHGVMNWWARGPGVLFDAELKANKKALLQEMAPFIGELGHDHLHFAPHLNLDDMAIKDAHWLLNTANNAASHGQWAMSYVSGFNMVRGWQQTTAATVSADAAVRLAYKAWKHNRPLTDLEIRKMRVNFGLDQSHVNALENMLNSGVIEVKTKNGVVYTNRLNMDKWDPAVARDFAAAITRHTAQLVQHPFAGETDSWTHTTMGSILTHLKTFPMLAYQKQFIRTQQFVDMEGITVLLMGIATAYLQAKVRAALNGKEYSESEYATQAFNYSNATGWLTMVADPLLTVVGLEDYRFNPYGEYSTLVPPVFSVATDQMRIPGALWHTATGQGDYADREALRALPFANTYFISNLFK